MTRYEKQHTTNHTERGSRGLSEPCFDSLIYSLPCSGVLGFILGCRWKRQTLLKDLSLAHILFFPTLHTSSISPRVDRLLTHHKASMERISGHYHNRKPMLSLAIITVSLHTFCSRRTPVSETHHSLQLFDLARYLSSRIFGDIGSTICLRKASAVCRPS